MAFFNLKSYPANVLTPIEVAWVQVGSAGVALLKETTAPSAVSGYGQLYVKSSDSRIYYKNSSGTESGFTSTALDNLSGVAINTSLLPALSGTIDLGSTSKIWNSVFASSLIANKIYPASDSTTALQFNKADGITNVLNIDTTNGYVGIGTTSPNGKLHVAWNQYDIDAEFIGAGGGFLQRNAGDHQSSPTPLFTFKRARGTLASPAAIQSGDYMFSFQVGGYDGMNWTSGWNGGARIYAAASENWTTSNHGTYMGFGTTANGSNYSDKMRLYGSGGLALGTYYATDPGTGNMIISGNVGIGTASPTAKLHLAAGTASVAPFKLTSGTNLTTPAAGALEFDGTSLYFTPSSERKTVAFSENQVTSFAAVASGDKDKFLHANASTGALEWITAVTSGATTALDNLYSVAINTSLLPATSGAIDLGSTSKMWGNLFLKSGGVINFNDGDVTLTHSSNTLTLGGGDLALGSNNLTLTGSIASTGSRVTKGWFTDLEVTNAIAGSITGNAATVTVADEASDTTCFPLFVTAASGSLPGKTNSGLTFNASTGQLQSTLVSAATGFVPDANDGAYLGTSALGFSDLFLASGAVINFNNGDVTLTHSSDALSIVGGTLAVTESGDTDLAYARFKSKRVNTSASDYYHVAVAGIEDDASTSGTNAKYLIGGQFEGIATGSSKNTAGTTGVRAHGLNQGSGTLNSAVGVNVVIGHYSASSGATTSEITGVQINRAKNAGTITNDYAFYIGAGVGANKWAFYGASGAGTILNVDTYSDTVGGTNRDLYVDNTGKFGYVSSSIKVKENVKDLSDTSWLYQLRPVSFDYKDKTKGINQMGLIAEEVDKVNPSLVSYVRTEKKTYKDHKNNKEITEAEYKVLDEKKKQEIEITSEYGEDKTQPETVSYSKLITPMLKEIQNLKKEIDQLKAKIK